MLVVSNLEKRYDNGEGIKSVSFTLKPGELTVLIGRSGAGKTTVLRCLNGLETLDAGSVSLHGTRPHRTEVAMVFQGNALIDNKTTLESVLDGSLARESSWRELVGWHGYREKFAALEMLHDLGLSGYADRRIGDLSGGQQQRVGVARALHQRPEVLLADEPVAAQDPETARSTLEFLRRFINTERLYGLVSLHQPELAETIADHYLGLSDGNLVLNRTATAVERRDLLEVYNGQS